MDLIDRELQRPVGNPHLIGNIVTDSRPEGNTSAKALRRLRKSAPALHADVIAGKLSPHGAMIQAGFRKRTRGAAHGAG